MGIELYLDLLSPPCRSVYIFAKKNNITFTFKQMEVLKGQQHSDGFGKVNVLRKVPALKDGGFTLAERLLFSVPLAIWLNVLWGPSLESHQGQSICLGSDAVFRIKLSVFSDKWNH
uniref:GST N-terminal domain-containing protein n=1 Tax=Chelydra serpentina TaxID=8475 RepID=A0A8C3THP3_CHESE